MVWRTQWRGSWRFDLRIAAASTAAHGTSGCVIQRRKDAVKCIPLPWMSPRSVTC